MSSAIKFVESLIRGSVCGVAIGEAKLREPANKRQGTSFRRRVLIDGLLPCPWQINAMNASYCALNLLHLVNSRAGTPEIHIPCRVENVGAGARNKKLTKAGARVPNPYVEVVFVVVNTVVNIMLGVVVIGAAYPVAAALRVARQSRSQL